VEKQDISAQIEGVEHAEIRDAHAVFAPALEPVMRKRLQLPAQLLDFRLDLSGSADASHPSLEAFKSYRMDYCVTMNSTDLITTDPDILGGTPVFKGTRVPIKTLFEYLENNYSLEEFLECFPSVTHDMACQILERSESALLLPAKA